MANKYNCATGIITILWQKGDLMVRTAVAKDQLFIDKLQKEESYAVGFIQKTIWKKYVFGGERNFTTFICEANNDPVGYVLITPGHDMRKAKIQQIAVRNDARRLQYGSALLEVGKMYCEDNGRTGFTLRCRTDLPSNNFWEALGFEKYGVWEKGKVNHVGFKASKDINLWRINLNDKIIGLFE